MCDPKPCVKLRISKLSGGEGTQAVHPVYEVGQTDLASCCAGPGDRKHGSVLSLLYTEEV